MLHAIVSSLTIRKMLHMLHEVKKKNTQKTPQNFTVQMKSFGNHCLIFNNVSIIKVKNCDLIFIH